MKLEDIVIIDVETSGPDVFENDLLSVYMTSVSGNRSIELFLKFDENIRWGSIGKRYFNKYKDLWEEKAEDPRCALERLNQYLESHLSDKVILSGHNVAFDYYFIKKAAKKYNVKLSDKLSHRLIDTHSIIAMKVMQGVMPQYSLKPNGAADYFGIKTTNRHSAKHDALLSKEILTRLFDGSTH